MFGWVRDAASKAYECALYAWVWLTALWRVHVLKQVMSTSEFWVYKVVALNDDEDSDANVTKYFAVGSWSSMPSWWEDRVRMVTGWTSPNIKLDVRYLSHGRKFRLVLRPGDKCTLPEDLERHRGGPKGVLCAEMVADENTVDVTPRVLKYQGPAKDFHKSLGLRVAVRDMWPKDEPEELAHMYDGLRIIDSNLHTVAVPFACEDIAEFLST